MSSATPDGVLTEQITDGELILNYMNNSIAKTGPISLCEQWKVRRELLVDYWSRFHSRHTQLLAFKEYLQEEPYFLNNVYSKVHKSFLSSITEIDNVLTPTPTTGLQVAVCNTVCTLPKIPLPKFNYNQIEWQTFKDAFETRIKNDNTINPVDKLHYLLNCLENNSSNCLKNLAITGENFEVAWNTLIRRFDNKRHQLSSHLNSLISAPPMNSANTTELNKLHDTFDISIRAFQHLGRPVKHWDDFLVQLFINKLDPDTRADWEKSLESSQNFATYDQLIIFIENRTKSLMASS